MESLNYSDICLIPKYSELRSRSEADTSVEFLGRRYASCVIPANMKAVIDRNIAKWLSENDYFYIYHRFEETLSFVRNANSQNWKLISISIGVKQEDKDLILKILNVLDYHGHINKYERAVQRVDVVTIDVAMGHHILVKEMISYIKNTYRENNVTCPKIIAGNVCTSEAVMDLEVWGADAVKCGIAGGFVCSTRNMTGFHIPMFSCIETCARISAIPIISDGGIRENGDIAKTLVAGASMTMIGGLFAACIDSPAENVYTTCLNDTIQGAYGKKLTGKKFFGSASAKNKGFRKNIEGVEIDIPCNNMNYAEKYQEIKESLQSSISYAGGNKLTDLQNVKWIVTK